MGVNKCNISKYIKDRIDKFNFGLNCDFSDSKILENYINYLDCDTVDINICYPDTCSNPTLIIVCDIVISDLAVEIDNDNITITPTVTGGTQPYSYQWSYNTNLFDLQEGTNDTSSNLKLVLKTGSFDYIEAGIGLTITDVNDCKNSKTCVLSNSIMDCSRSVACNNITDLHLEPFQCGSVKFINIT